jgi:regulator of protease activity HflC (stomatin/prohibitin superfamily)
MASRKKRMAFKDYAEALARTEELAASGDQESEDFLAAAEAAAQFFLIKHDSRYFNRLDENHDTCGQAEVEHKWTTIKELW